MAMNHNSANQTTAPSAGAHELRCTLCSGHFPSPQALNCHMVRRVVNPTPHFMTRVIHYPILPPSPIPSDDDSSDSDSMASLGSDSDSDTAESGSGSTVSVPPPPPPVQAEEHRPRQVTLNLLGDWEAPLAEVFAREAAGVDLELSLKTAPATAVDLDLKLGL